MNRKPLSILKAGMAEICGLVWSGRPELNRRPPPPESMVPADLWRISVLFRVRDVAPNGLCSFLVPQLGSARTLGPRLRGVA